MDIKEIRMLSLNTGLSINYICKDHQISKLFFILENSIPNIVLKGGTGINRVYLDKTKRFSEDIDFDIYSKESINVIKNKLYSLLLDKLVDYKIDKPRIMNQTIRYDIHYTNEFDIKDKIRLEFRYQTKKLDNFDKKIIQNGFTNYKTTNYQVYELEEIILQKLFALVNRDEGKDIYDLYNLFDLNYSKSKLITLITKFNKLNKINLLIQSTLKLEKLLINQKEIKYLENSTNHFIIKELRQYYDPLIRDLLLKLNKLSIKKQVTSKKVYKKN
jgi:predicted nucleotidyltransferase component of viral defense system